MNYSDILNLEHLDFKWNGSLEKLVDYPGGDVIVPSLLSHNLPDVFQLPAADTKRQELLDSGCDSHNQEKTFDGIKSNKDPIITDCMWNGIRRFSKAQLRMVVERPYTKPNILNDPQLVESNKLLSPKMDLKQENNTTVTVNQLKSLYASLFYS